MANIMVWWWNSSKSRHELWSRNPADPAGVGQIVAVQAMAGADTSDVPGAQIFQYSADLAPFVQAAGRGDAYALAAVGQATDTLNAYYQQQGYTMAATPTSTTSTGQAGTQGTQARAVRLPADNIAAYIEGIEKTLGAAAAQNALNQIQHQLTEEMRQGGYDPATFFNMFPTPAQRTAAVAGGVATPDASSVRLSPDYQRAYTDAAVVTLKGDRLTQEEYLQQVANAYGAHATGAKRLQEYGDAVRARDKAQQQYAIDQQRNAADPGNDQRMRPMAGGQWSYENQAGAYSGIQKSAEDADRLQQQYWPDVYQADQQRKRRDAQGSWLPDDVRRQVYPKAYGEPQAYASGGRVPQQAGDDTSRQVAQARAYLTRYARGGRVGR